MTDSKLTLQPYHKVVPVLESNQLVDTTTIKYFCGDYLIAPLYSIKIGLISLVIMLPISETKELNVSIIHNQHNACLLSVTNTW